MTLDYANSYIYDLSEPGRMGASLPPLDVPESDLPEGYLRTELPLPEVAEVELVRHYVRLSQKNYSVDSGFYPLGSCTMKYNPKVNDQAAHLLGFARIHPLQPEETVQGAMALMHDLQEALAEISGFAAISLQPSAGAHGELAGVLIMRKYQLDRGETQRNKIIVPDSAHGTNPASTAMSGLKAVTVPSDDRGNVDLEALKAVLDDTVVGMMLTNPNTVGLFDEHVMEICDLVHSVGGLMYGDGANLNAIMGIAKMADLGFDVMHFNLHKTFSTPHGGGGPGSGPVGVTKALEPFLPGPIVGREEKEAVEYHWVWPAKSIGRVKSFYGNFGVLVRAYTYINMLGAEGLLRTAENAVLNANYVQARLKEVYPVPFGDRFCMHEFVASGELPGVENIHTLDIAKRLIDYGFHPPTIYFPSIVHESIMIEPTETESKATLDAFSEAMLKIAQEAREEPELLHSAPHKAPVGRLDEVLAARRLELTSLPE